MKRKSSRYRAMSLPAHLVRPIENSYPSLVALPSASALPGVREKKIFVIKQVLYVPQANDARKTIRRILIFDDHPDSLRLVFGRRADSHVHPSDPERMTSLGVALLWILVVSLMVAVFWPLL